MALTLNTGGRYNPSTDSWTATSTTNAPAARAHHTAVWTGSEMIVWGGFWLRFEHRRQILRRCTESDTHANTFSDPNRDCYADGDCNAHGNRDGNSLQPTADGVTPYTDAERNSQQLQPTATADWTGDGYTATATPGATPETLRPRPESQPRRRRPRLTVHVDRDGCGSRYRRVSAQDVRFGLVR